jgi:cytochrome c biogenesis protein CcmG, thiol:disulfide interchange protein DsbE
LRLPNLVLGLLAAVITASAGFAAQPASVATPRWPVLDAYAGKVVLLDFWASWCAPCLQSFPWMNDLQQDYDEAGLVVLAVNLDQDRTLAEAFLGKTPARFRVEYDPAGTVARQFDVQAMPTSFLIDRQGRIRARHAGFKEKHREGREQEIAKLLQESAP